MYNTQLFATGAGLIILLLIILVSITVSVFYLLTLQNLLKEISVSNREIEPSNVWLMFIPLFNMIYPFILYPKICDSVKKEMESRNMAESGDYGRSIGITMPILSLCGIIPFLGSLAGIANLVLFIIFWSKMAGYKTRLINSRGMQGISNRTDIL